MKKVYVIKNRYVDSVTLMGVAVELTELPGVTGAESGMGTSQNVDLLTGLDYPVPAGVTKNDLMIALDAEGPEALEAAFAAAQGQGKLGDAWTPRSAAAMLRWVIKGLCSEWLLFGRRFDLAGEGGEALRRLFRGFARSGDPAARQPGPVAGRP